jgi:tetratricopeptide (TPR) repeat protein
VQPPRRRRGRHRLRMAVVALLNAIAAAGGITFYVVRISRKPLDRGGNGIAGTVPAPANPVALDDRSPATTTTTTTTTTATTHPGTRPATVPVWTAARPAPPPGTPPLDDVGRALDNFVKAIAGRKGFLIDTSFDGDRLVREIQALGFLSDITDANRAAAAENLVRQLSRTFVDSPDLKFRAIDVRSLEPLRDPGEVIACVRALAGSGRVNYRFWMRQAATGWKIYDFETVDGGPRSSQAIAAAIAAGASALSAPAWAAYVPRFSAIYSLLAHKEFETARAEILKLDHAGFPPQYEAMRLTVKGMLYARTGEPAKALLLYDKAQSVRSDLPGLHLLRAGCYNALGQHEKALASARLHLDLFGDDAKAYVEIGRAYEGMGYPEVAVQAYERGLADDPGNDVNRRSLDRILHPPKPAEPEPEPQPEQ